MKNLRQQKILEIIDKYDIDTQEALISKLKENGYNVTQTTISRDIAHRALVESFRTAHREASILTDSLSTFTEAHSLIARLILMPLRRTVPR